MKLPLPSDFFAPVKLSAQEGRQLKLVEAQLLERYLRSYEEFSGAAHQDAVDRYQLRRRKRGDLVETSSGKWAFARQQGGLKVFRKHAQRHDRQYNFQHYQPRVHDRQTNADGKAGRPVDARHRHADHSHLAGVLVTGTVDGTVEELMYGSMWGSAGERAARSFFTRDGVVDAAVLHTIERPSPIDPWRSLAVKWALKRAPPLGAALLVKDRDFCYLAASGVVQASDGARIGYRLRHSVAFPSCPAFQNRSVVRGQLFFCSLFRQLKHGCVEVFHQGSYDAGGGVLRSVAEKVVVATLVNYSRVPQFAMTKKLAHAVRQHEHDRRGRLTSVESFHDSFESDRRCGVCLDLLLDHHHHGSDEHRRCAVCRHQVCANCSIRKEVEAPRLRGGAAKMSRSGRAVARCFCKHCIAKVERDDTTMYAVRDASWASRASRVEQERALQAPRHHHRRHEHHTTGRIRSGVRWGHDEIDDDFPSAEAARQHPITLFAPDECTFEVDEQRMLPSRHRRNTIAGIAVSGPVHALIDRHASVPQLSVASPPPSLTPSVENEPAEVSTPSTVGGNAIGAAWSSRGRSATAPHVPLVAALETSDGGEESGSLARRRLPRTQSLFATNAPPILLRSDVGRRNWRSSMSALSLSSSLSSGSGSADGAGVRIPVPTRSHRRHRHHRRLSGSSHSSRSARCSSVSSNSSASSTVLVSLSSRGLPARKRVDFPPLPAALARPQTRRAASHA